MDAISTMTTMTPMTSAQRRRRLPTGKWRGMSDDARMGNPEPTSAPASRGAAWRFPGQSVWVFAEVGKDPAPIVASGVSWSGAKAHLHPGWAGG